MRYSGQLTVWKDDQGFGFITPDGGGERVFCHIKAFHRDASRPAEGDSLTYELAFDERKRLRAANVRRADERIPEASSAQGRKAPALAAVFCLALVLASLAGLLSFWVPVYCLALSFATYIAYWLDKKKALNEMRRTPESNLHLLALIGGWPGALAAQRIERHKSRKPEFQRVFWLTVLLNCSFAGWLFFPSGQAFLKTLGL
ncbi:MAG: DNA-binding protein [Candidatus Dactylopiibacterium carminicum]|uniref:DNA-binding protein n=1 Tax=Candidatus Dactylopiibacterium carminicum TaxID=857335 RepID=A0A272ESW6_9RHOO|nr:DUF1294 domain-containing protein [Candidatus Dactylopiibacterium carminicum]KAF7600753.1 DUF1294 domain-containing protein [Candidatus Dactylopiibacterium carminicum]PAS93178.1 MAG: DNA-binding protein [Candidatus Dactylopiibacterium carminicum]PAT00759.1 MAG: hypothetical protein BSR46_01260 [Candidatus Dactylopiibacterium carminicum]